MCSEKKSLEIADKLDVLQHYPAPGKARAAIAEMVREICPTDKAADVLFRQIVEAYNTWPGPQEFTQFARGKMRPQAQRAELQEWDPDQWRHQVECSRCGDDGYIRGAGEFARCNCDAGRNIDSRFLKLLNETAQAAADPVRSVRTDAPIKPSVSEIAKVMRQKSARTQ
jgi:hypothetical protein